MQTPKTEKKRTEWIDVLRGAAMLFVIYGHLLSGYHHTNYYLITSPIKIPLFFAITGYVFNKRGGDVHRFFINLFHKLVVPLLFFTAVLMPFKVFAAWKGFVDHSVGDVILSFLTGAEFWYIPCCIVAEILFFFVCKYASKEIEIVAACLVLSTLGFVLGNLNILKTWNINTAFTAQLFLLIGFIFKKHESWFKEKWNIVLPVSGLIYISFCVLSYFLYPGKAIDVHKNSYYNIPIVLVLIFAGNLSLFCFASKFDIKSRTLAFVGRNTICYYVIHEYAIGALLLILGLLHIKESGTYLFEFVLLVLTCLICAAAAVFINRYLPFAVGRGRPKRS